MGWFNHQLPTGTPKPTGQMKQALTPLKILAIHNNRKKMKETWVPMVPSLIPSLKLTAKAPENGCSWKTIISFWEFPYFQVRKTLVSGRVDGYETMVRPPQLRNSSFPSQAEVLKGPLTLVTTWNHPTLVTVGGRRAHLFGSNRAECDDFGIFTYKNICIIFFLKNKQIHLPKGVVFFPVLMSVFFGFFFLPT